MPIFVRSDSIQAGRGIASGRAGEDRCSISKPPELEAAAFRRLVAHLRERTDVQNIDLMNLAGFCRNCLSNWMSDAAKERGLSLSKDEAREHIYGMPYEAGARSIRKKRAPSKRQLSLRPSPPRRSSMVGKADGELCCSGHDLRCLREAGAGALSGLVNSAAVTLDPARAVLEGGKAADIGALNALGEVGKYRLLAEGQAAALRRRYPQAGSPPIARCW